MEEKAIQEQINRKHKRVKASSIVNVTIYSALSLAIIAGILLAPRFQKTTVVVRDGETVSGFTVRDIVVVPGEEVTYQVKLFSYVPSDYTVSVDFQGDEDKPINDYIVASLRSDNIAYETCLGEVVNQGFQAMGSEKFDWFSRVNLTVSYKFSDEITEEIMEPFSVVMRLRVNHERR